jgi:hypothetical protein
MKATMKVPMIFIVLAVVVLSIFAQAWAETDWSRPERTGLASVRMPRIAQVQSVRWQAPVMPALPALPALPERPARPVRAGWISWLWAARTPWKRAKRYWEPGGEGGSRLKKIDRRRR